MRAIQRAGKIFLRRPVNVIPNHKIQFAIAVIIHPGSAGGKFINSPHTCRLGHIGKCAVVIVVKKMALAHGSNEDVIEAVIIVIANGNAQAIHHQAHAGTRGHVSK